MMQVLEVKIQVRKQLCRSSEAKMQDLGSKKAGPESDDLWPELMYEGIETVLDSNKANSTFLVSKIILQDIFVSELNHSLSELTKIQSFY